MKNVSDWYTELLAAVEEFTEKSLQTPNGVGYSTRVYRQINLIVNREKNRISNDAGEHPDDDMFIEIGSVAVGDISLEIWTSDDCSDDMFILMADGPEGGGEPYNPGSGWRKAS